MSSQLSAVTGLTSIFSGRATPSTLARSRMSPIRCVRQVTALGDNNVTVLQMTSLRRALLLASAVLVWQGCSIDDSDYVRRWSA